MSLKAFHLVFLVASTVLAFGFGLWGIREYKAGDASVSVLISAIISLVLGPLLVGYGRYFLRKLKDISYL